MNYVVLSQFKEYGIYKKYDDAYKKLYELTHTANCKNPDEFFFMEERDEISHEESQIIENLYTLFSDVSDDEMNEIYKDIKQCESEHILRIPSLDIYAEKINNIFDNDVYTIGTEYAKQLFFREITRRYFKKKGETNE